MRHRFRLAFLLLVPLMSVGASAAPCLDVVRLRSETGWNGHLQGVATDGTNLFWSWTRAIVRTDFEGNVLSEIATPYHHGDLCVHGGKVYVAVNLGSFNRPSGTEAVSEVRAFDAGTLAAAGTWKIPELIYGAGGITHYRGRFYVVGGLPDGMDGNAVYEYDGKFRFRRKIPLAIGWTNLGIQTVDATPEGFFRFGIYGRKGERPYALVCRFGEFGDPKAYRRVDAGNPSIAILRANGTDYCAAHWKVAGGKDMWTGLIHRMREFAQIEREASTNAFFRTERKTDGTWRLLDPAGRPFVIRSVGGANMRGPYCEKLGVRPYEAFLATQGVTRAQWVERTAGRLKDWGFNAIGSGADSWLERHGFAHMAMLAFSGHLADRKAGPEMWITPWRGAPSQAFPNVFHPDFERLCDEVAEAECIRRRDDPGLVGYYLDNELNWWGRGDWYMCGMLDEVLRTLPEGHLARKAALKVLERTVGVDAAAYLALPEPKRLEARRMFTEAVATRYFRITTEAVRRCDPNHLVLGCRFAGVQGGADEVWRIAGRFCDAVSFNCYPSADFANGRLTASVHHRTVGKNDGRFRDVELGRLWDGRQAVAGKPLLITEWSFIGLDAGLPCKVGCGQRLATQTERARAVGMFLDFAAARPSVIGTEFFMWVDEPALGCTGAHPEDSNYGLVNVRDEPYAEVTAAFRNRPAAGREAR